jgi:phage/plasmid-like protein (TIGR03299 family)
MQIKQLDNCTNVNEVLTSIGADQPYREEPISCASGTLPAYKAIVDGTGKPVCVNNASYNLLQPIEAFAYMDDVRQSINANYTEAGFLKGGRALYISAKVPETINLNPEVGDILSFVLNFWTSFDGSMQSNLTMGWERLVCSNGMTAFDFEQNKSIKHTRYQHERIARVVENITGVRRVLQSDSAAIQTLTRTRIQRVDAEVITRRWFKGDSTRSQNVRGEVLNLFEQGLGNRGQTCWDLLNGLTEYQNHRVQYRNTEGTTSAENRFISLALGDSRKLQQRAVRDLMHYADAGLNGLS